MFSLNTYLVALLCLVAIPSSNAVEYNVTVGGPGLLTFQPESVTAVANDVIRFIFKQKNHTATQSSLQSPCTKLDGGFDSGFQPVDEGNADGPFPNAVYTVPDPPGPVWVYCAQGTHCSSAGMVFAVNPGDQFAQFKAAATGGPAPSGTSPATPSATGSTTHKVVVGGPGSLTFQPNNIKPKAGDVVEFEFRQKNHTATQSTFAAPCRPLSAGGQTGLDSGFKAVADGSTDYPKWTVRINDTKPIWMFCMQGNHCAQGMVMAINSDDSGPNSFTAFQAKAREGGNATSPAAPTSTGGGSRTGMGSSFALAMFGIVAGLIL